MEDVVEGLKISNVSVSVQELSNGSPLKEIFAIAVFLAYQEDLEEEVPELVNKLTGINVPDSADTLVTVLVLIAAIYLIDKAIRRLFPGKETEELKKEYREKVADLAKMTNTREDEIEEALDKRYKERTTKSLMKNVHDFFSPSQIEGGVGIDLPSGEKGISQEAIKEIPDELDYEQLETRNVYTLPDAVLEIHRSDIDYNQYGWVAVIPDVSDKRVKMELAPEIKPSEVYGRKSLRGEVDVVEELSEGGEYEIKYYHVRSVQGVEATKHDDA